MFKHLIQMVDLKSILLMLLFSIAMPWHSFGQLTLTIEISGLQNNEGQVLLEFCNENGTKTRGITQAISGKKCIMIIDNLKPGKYAFKYFHDENKNEKLDTNWIGIPTEEFGFSNNAEGRFGPPSFEKTIFILKGNTTLKCTPIYY